MCFSGGIFSQRALACYDFAMSKQKILFYTFEIILGVLMFIYGGYDDSPGGQFLGLVAIAFGVVSLIRGRVSK